MPRNTKGYSLFEVIVAFAIMSLVLSVLLPGQNQLFRRVVAGEDRVVALDYAASLVALHSLDASPRLGVEEFDYRNWKVRQELVEANDGLLRLTVVVKNRQGQELARLDHLGAQR